MSRGNRFLSPPCDLRPLAWSAVPVLLLLVAGCGLRCSPSAPASTPPGPVSSATCVPSASSGPEASLRHALDTLFTDPQFANAFWGVRVEHLDGQPLYDVNGDKLLLPASNLKVYTTAAALELLGPDFTYTTRLEALGSIDAEGRLVGTLLITGSGDPTLGSWHVTDESNDSRVLLKDWANRIREAGIREIHGDIVGDGRVFTEQYYLGSWEIEDLPYWYAAGSSGLAMEENCFRFLSAPGKQVGEPALLTLIPDTKYVTVVNQTRTTAPGTESDLDIVYRDLEANTVRFAHTIALDKKPFQQRGSVWDGARYSAFLLKEALEREGIRVSGEARNIRSLPDPTPIDSLPPDQRRLLATHTSPPLRRIIALINKPSHNFLADQVLRTLGYVKGKEGSFEGGAKVVKDWLKDIGAPDAEHFQMLDGSGLARRNYVQPRQTCAVLRRMHTRETLRAPYSDSLPIAGVDADLKDRMTDPPTKANVRAKTGFIGNVRSLSGYVTDAEGETLVFSMMVNQNQAGTKNADKAIDQACRLLAEFTTKAVRTNLAPPPGH